MQSEARRRVEGGAIVIVFFSFSHVDTVLRDRLEVSLAMLKRQGVIETWHDREILAGDDFAREIDENIERADIVLLLVSPEFLASQYCYDVEMKRAMQRHEAGETRVIPIILRPCQWQDAPFGDLKAIPKDGRPVTKHADFDDAFLDIANAIKEVAAKARPPRSRAEVRSVDPTQRSAPAVSAPEAPRSSNLHLKRSFSQADEDKFLDEAFEYIASYFEESLGELDRRNAQIEARYKRIDGSAFSAVAYRNGKAVARCRIFYGSQMFGRGIAYSNDDRGGNHSFNESLSVARDDHNLGLQPLGLGGHGNKAFLTMVGSAEFFWERFMEPLQR